MERRGKGREKREGGKKEGRKEGRKKEKEVEYPRNTARIHRTRASTVMVPFLY